MTNDLQHQTASISAQDVPEAIEWYDGMLLTSEHFRSMSDRGEMLSRYGLALSHPFAWGVIGVRFDPTALSDRKLTLLRLEAIMPGGHLVSIGLHDPSVITLDLNLFKDQLVSGAANVYVTVGDRLAQPSNNSTASTNETLGFDQVYIPRVKQSLSLHVSDTPAGRARLPIARIQFGDGSFTFTEYTPPSLTVPTESQVGQICADISAHIREKAQFLVNRLADSSVAANSSLELKTQAQLQGLVSALPALEALLGTGVSHPYSLYVSLCNLAGHIAGIASDPLPPVFPKYDHTDILTCFQKLSLYILRTLEQGISEKWDVFSFAFTEGVFSLSPNEGWERWVRGDTPDKGRLSLALGLRFGPDVSREASIRWGQTCRIGTRSVIPALVERRVLGVSRNPVNSLEDYYAPKDVTLFSLNIDRELLKSGEELRIDNRSESKIPLQVLLYSRKPDIA